MICELCGGPTRRDNAVGICMRNPDCRREHERKYNDSERGGLCGICGVPSRTLSAIGICNRNPECRRGYDRARWALRPGARACKVCGGSVKRNSKVDICKRNPECRRASVRERLLVDPEYREAEQARQAAERARHPLQRYLNNERHRARQRAEKMEAILNGQ